METTAASPAVPTAAQPAPEAEPTLPASSLPAPAAGRGDGKRKRGRPRKYGPEGSLLRPLKATPISVSVPDDAGGGQYTPAAAVGAVMKSGRGRPVGFVSRAAPVAVTAAAVVVSAPAAAQTQLGPLGELVTCASGANFTPHILNVAAGEDVNMKGRFELISLSGSFTPTDSGGTRSRSGGMSVSLAATDGRVVGGGVAGLLVAASPVQVVVGSFLPSYQLDQNAKKPMIEITTVPPPPAIGFTISSGDMEDSYSGSQPRSATAKANSASVFRVENWTAPAQPAPEARKTPSSERPKCPSREGEVEGLL